MTTHTVFVYGTLKKHYANSYLMKESKFLGVAVSAGRYLMKQVGFPAIFPSHRRGSQVRGELYEISDKTLNSLDNLEGNGMMYQREVQTFQLPDGPIQAWVYLAMLPFWKRLHNHEDIIPNENGELIWAGRLSQTSKPTDSQQHASG